MARGPRRHRRCTTPVGERPRAPAPGKTALRPTCAHRLRPRTRRRRAQRRRVHHARARRACTRAEERTVNDERCGATRVATAAAWGFLAAVAIVAVVAAMVAATGASDDA